MKILQIKMLIIIELHIKFSLIMVFIHSFNLNLHKFLKYYYTFNFFSKIGIVKS